MIWYIFSEQWLMIVNVVLGPNVQHCRQRVSDRKNTDNVSKHTNNHFVNLVKTSQLQWHTETKDFGSAKRQNDISQISYDAIAVQALWYCFIIPSPLSVQKKKRTEIVVLIFGCNRSVKPLCWIHLFLPLGLFFSWYNVFWVIKHHSGHDSMQ